MAASQLPEGGQIVLDHVGHFVPDIAAAADALARCGFLPTPLSVQSAPGADGVMRPTGTGNVCAMLRAGYLEVLAKTSDTPLAAEFDAAMARWAGVHLAAFAVAEPDAAYRRLLASGIAMRPLVHMRRPVETADGMSEARFTVLRPERGVMPEGRMQLLTHHTEAEVWQPRWLAQPNGVTALLGVMIVTDAVAEAAARFERLLGIAPQPGDRCLRFSLARGHVVLAAPEHASAIAGPPPGLPWIAAYGLQVESLERAGRCLNEAGVETRRAGRALLAAFPPVLGRGHWAFAEEEAALPWL